jgi:hypothetical protein
MYGFRGLRFIGLFGCCAHLDKMLGYEVIFHEQERVDVAVVSERSGIGIGFVG